MGSAFEPKISKEKKQISPIDYVVNPDFDNISKMQKIFGSHHLNFDLRIRELNPSYSLYSQPRFFLKVEQMREFQTNFP